MIGIDHNVASRKANSVKERSKTLLLHNLTVMCMAFELVGSTFVCYEELTLCALGVADSRTTHTAPMRTGNSVPVAVFSTGTVSFITVIIICPHVSQTYTYPQ